MSKFIAVTIGDIDGIGINLLVKEWRNNKINNFVIITNLSIFNKLKKISNKKINLIKYNNKINNFNKLKLNILNIETKNKYTNVLDSLKKTYDLTKKGLFIGIVTLPLNKKKINVKVDKNFIDQTTFFSNLEKNQHSNMIFLYKKKFFIPLTTHIELKNVYKKFKNNNFLYKKIFNINKTLKNDFNIKKPKLAIAGINPHSGENGLISKDEEKYLIPIIKKLKKNKINIRGPFAGDSIINKSNINEYNAFLFTFHDQALIPFKIISKFEGINYTSNLKIIRISPSHGTATNIINNKIASSKGLINSFKTINLIDKNRQKI